MKPSKKIPQEKIKSDVQKLINVDTYSELEKKVFDLPLYKKTGERENVTNKNPYVVLKYFQQEWECFSEWDKEELRAFSSFLSTLSSHTWSSVYKSGGVGPNKVGLGYTKYDLSTMKAGSTHLEKVINKISPDIDFFELRVTQKIRVHGFQSCAAFFLVLLDREHRVFSV